MNHGQKLFKTASVFLFIMVEVAAGACLFYFIIFLEHFFGGLAGGVDRADPILYWFAYGGKLLLLGADGIIILMFVAHGVVSAYDEIWRQQ